MKYYTLSFIIILFLTTGCKKEINDNPFVSKTESGSLLDTITNCTWVFTEYHDKVSSQSQTDSTHFFKSTYYMSIISSGYETAKINTNGKLYLNRDYDFSFAPIDYFNKSFQPTSFVSSNHTEPYNDTANYSIGNKSIILSNHIKYLPDTMSILNADTACLVLSGILHINSYNVNRTIILYKNTRWYGGYRNYSGLWNE